MNLVNKSITSIFLKTLLAGMVFLLSGCFKDFKEDYLFTDFMVEFDAATWESRAPGKTYPVLGPVEKGSGIYQYQINLLGEQRSVDQEIRYRVDPNESTAVEGEHFRLVDEGRVVMAANESTAFVTIEI